MQFQYRNLSKNKLEELSTKKLANMYGIVETFDSECVTTPDESIVFTQLAYSHENDIPNEYFLKYNNWFIYIYSFRKILNSEKNTTGENYYISSDISKIVNITFEKKEEDISLEEVFKVLKEILPIWNQHHSGKLNHGDHIITEVTYKGEKL